MKNIKIISLVLVLCLILIAFAGCATVQPWEREILSEPIMQFDENPIEKWRLENYKHYHEGSVGATGSQGGGCGCG